MNFSNDKLEKLGKSLGADVPFFIKGGFQLAEGIGDILSPQKTDILKDLHFLLVTPPIHLSTEKAYGSLNKPLRPIQSHSKFPPVSKPVNWQLFDNDFENMIGKTYPEIHEIKIALKKNGALFSGLSGSGSTVFGIFENLQNAEVARGKFPRVNSAVLRLSKIPNTVEPLPDRPAYRAPTPCRFSLMSPISGYVFRNTFSKSLSNNCQFTGSETGANLEWFSTGRKGLFNDRYASGVDM